MSKKGQELLIWGLLLIGLGAIVLGIYAAVVTPGQPEGAAGVLLTPVAADEQKRGPESAKAVLVEYSDLECPACKYFYGMLKQLEQERGNEVQFVFRHFPLQQHRYARTAAVAAEAAGKQGKFWEMHDLLFERQEEWAKSEDVQRAMTGYAALLGLDVGRFELDMRSPELAAKIEESVAEGTRQKINGTPTFFLNGKAIQFRSYEELNRLIDGAVNK